MQDERVRRFAEEQARLRNSVSASGTNRASPALSDWDERLQKFAEEQAHHQLRPGSAAPQPGHGAANPAVQDISEERLRQFLESQVLPRNTASSASKGMPQTSSANSQAQAAETNSNVDAERLRRFAEEQANLARANTPGISV